MDSVFVVVDVDPSPLTTVVVVVAVPSPLAVVLDPVLELPDVPGLPSELVDDELELLDVEVETGLEPGVPAATHEVTPPTVIEDLPCAAHC